jgi:parallel beta-helix repeat protein
MSSEKHPNLQLHKWAPTDYVRREEWNENFGIIDDKIGILNRKIDHVWVDVVEDFGADPTGATDSTIAIQNAIESVTSGTIYFPEGTYLISSTIWIHSNIRLKGAGGRTKKSIIKRANGAWWHALAAGVYTGGGLKSDLQPGLNSYLRYRLNGDYYSYNNQGENIIIEGLFIDGNSQNAGTPPVAANNYTPETTNTTPSADRGSNIWIIGVDTVILDDVWSYNASNDGAFIGVCKNVFVTNSKFSDNNLVNPTGQPTLNGLTIAGSLNDTTYTYDDKMNNNYNDSLVVHNCIFENNKDLGVAFQTRSDIAGGSNVTNNGIISSCTAANNSGAGIGAESYFNIFHIENCIIFNNYKGITMLNAPKKVIITGNTIMNNTFRGILVDGANNLVISNNIFRNNTNPCIDYYDSAALSPNAMIDIKDNQIILESFKENDDIIVKLNATSSTSNNAVIRFENNGVRCLDKTTDVSAYTFTPRSQCGIFVGNRGTFIAKNNHFENLVGYAISVDALVNPIFIENNTIIDVIRGTDDGSGITRDAIFFGASNNPRIGKVSHNYIIFNNTAKSGSGINVTGNPIMVDFLWNTCIVGTSYGTAVRNWGGASNMTKARLIGNTDATDTTNNNTVIQIGQLKLLVDSDFNLRSTIYGVTSKDFGDRFIKNLIGPTSNRPTTGLYAGMMYFDTTLNKPIFRNNTNTAWVDATGATV